MRWSKTLSVYRVQAFVHRIPPTKKAQSHVHLNVFQAQRSKNTGQFNNNYSKQQPQQAENFLPAFNQKKLCHNQLVKGI